MDLPLTDLGSDRAIALEKFKSKMENIFVKYSPPYSDAADADKHYLDLRGATDDVLHLGYDDSAHEGSRTISNRSSSNESSKSTIWSGPADEEAIFAQRTGGSTRSSTIRPSSQTSVWITQYFDLKKGPTSKRKERLTRRAKVSGHAIDAQDKRINNGVMLITSGIAEDASYGESAHSVPDGSMDDDSSPSGGTGEYTTNLRYIPPRMSQCVLNVPLLMRRAIHELLAPTR